MDANRVFRGLWQGSRPDLVEAAHAGFDTVVLAAVEYQPPAPRGLRVIRVPIEDDPDSLLSPEETDLAIGAAHEVAQRVLGGRNVLVTCHAGLNRSGLISALALHMMTGWGCRDVVRMVRGARGQYALSNPQFVLLLNRHISPMRANRGKIRKRFRR